MNVPCYKRIDLQQAAASVCKFAFAVSLLLPSLVERGGSGPGFIVLMVGWLGPLVGIYAWYANPLLYLSLRLSRSRRGAARVVAIGGFCLALTALTVKKIPYDDGYHDLIGFGIGYYLWLACFPLAIVSTLGNGCSSAEAIPANEERVNIPEYLGFQVGRCVSYIKKWF